MSGGTQREVTLYAQLYLPSRKRWLLIHVARYKSKSPNCELFDQWEFDGATYQSNDADNKNAVLPPEDQPIEWHCKTLKPEYSPVVFTARQHMMMDLETNSVLQTLGLLESKYHDTTTFQDDFADNTTAASGYNTAPEAIIRKSDYTFDIANFFSLDRVMIWGNEVSDPDDIMLSIPPHDREWSNWHRTDTIIETEDVRCWKCRFHAQFLMDAWNWKYVPQHVIDSDDVISRICTTTKPNKNTENDKAYLEEYVFAKWTKERRIKLRSNCLRILLGRLLHDTDGGVLSIIESFLPPPPINKLRFHQFVSFYC